MKNFLKSKGFIVTSLAVLCITILGVCWYAGQDKSDPFLPDESPPASTESTWSENNSQTDGSNGADAYDSPQPTAPVEKYPKVVEESENEVTLPIQNHPRLKPRLLLLRKVRL